MLMAIPQKNSDPNRLFSPARIFQDPPLVPTEYSKDALAEYSANHRLWWHNHRSTLNELASDISTLQARVNDLAPAPTVSTPVPITVKL